MSITHGGRARRFRWAFSSDRLVIENDGGLRHAYSLPEIQSILAATQEEFGKSWFPLANNVEKLHRRTEVPGLGSTIYRLRPGDTLHAQGASYLGVVLEEAGVLEWNGRTRGIQWRLARPAQSLGKLRVLLSGPLDAPTRGLKQRQESVCEAKPIFKAGSRITNLKDWELRAGPKRKEHWEDERSAKELARRWLSAPGTGFPVEVTQTLLSNPAFAPVVTWSAEPEARLPFDQFRGEPRNSDLVVHAEDRYGTLVLAIEGKADESFSETVAEALAAAVDRRLANPRSNGVARIEQLSAALFGERQGAEPQLGGLRYQLLTATAGALAEAERRQTARAVLLIHEFVTVKTADSKHELNAQDLDRFVIRLSHREVRSVEAGHVYGPFKVPGVPLFSPGTQLFIGKARCNLRDNDG